MAQFCTGHQTDAVPGQNGEPRRTGAQVKLLDSQSADRPRNHVLLDLLGAFEDVVDLIWTYPQISIVAAYAR